MARGKSSSTSVEAAQGAAAEDSKSAGSGIVKAAFGVGASLAVVLGGSLGGASEAWALTPYGAACNGGSGSGFTSSGTISNSTTYCGTNTYLGTTSSFVGTIMSDDATAPTAGLAVGSNAIIMNANSVIQMNQYLDMTGHKITGVANGLINATSTDAINGSQLYTFSISVDSLSTSMSTGISSMTACRPLRIRFRLV